MIDTLIGAAVEAASNTDDRALSAARPSRSVSAVRQERDRYTTDEPGRPE